MFALLLALTIDGATNFLRAGPPVAVMIVAGMICMVGYLQVVRLDDGDGRWDALEPTDRALQPAQYLTAEDIREEVETDLQRSGALGVLGTGLWLTALGIILVVPCFVAAALAVTLARAYPLPDLLVLGWAGYALVSRSTLFDLPQISREAVDIEGRLFEGISHGLRSIKGLALAIYVVCGAFAAAYLFWLGVQISAAAASTDSVLVQARPLLVWNLGGIALLGLLVGGYTLWFWVREFRRLDRFLLTYEGTDEPPQQDPRVVGWTVPSLLFSVIAVTAIVGADARPVPLAVAALWPVLAAGTITGAWLTRRRPHESVTGEDRVIVVALILQTLGTATFGNLEPYRTLLLDGELANPIPPEIVSIGMLVAGFAYFEDVSRYADAHDDYRRFALPAFLGLVAVSIGASSLLIEGWLRGAIALTAGVCLLGAAGLTLTRYFRI